MQNIIIIDSSDEEKESLMEAGGGGDNKEARTLKKNGRKRLKDMNEEEKKAYSRGTSKTSYAKHKTNSAFMKKRRESKLKSYHNRRRAKLEEQAANHTELGQAVGTSRVQLVRKATQTDNIQVPTVTSPLDVGKSHGESLSGSIVGFGETALETHESTRYNRKAPPQGNSNATVRNNSPVDTNGAALPFHSQLLNRIYPLEGNSNAAARNNPPLDTNGGALSFHSQSLSRQGFPEGNSNTAARNNPPAAGIGSIVPWISNDPSVDVDVVAVTSRQVLMIVQLPQGIVFSSHAQARIQELGMSKGIVEHVLHFSSAKRIPCNPFALIHEWYNITVMVAKDYPKIVLNVWRS